MRYILFFFILFLPTALSAQNSDLSGSWVGSLTQKAGGLSEIYVFSIIISQDSKGNLMGTSDIQINAEKDYGIISLKGKRTASGVSVQEIKIIEERLREYAYWCIKSYNLVYDKTNETLSGNWTANGSCGGGYIKVKRQKETVKIIEKPKKKPTKNIATTAAIKATQDSTKNKSIESNKKAEVLPENYLSVKAMKEALKNNESVVGKKVILDNLYFQKSKSNLLNESKQTLQEITDLLQENPNLRIKIIGHTDNIGNAQSNLNLSRLRAMAILNYLVNKGVTENRMTSEGLGSNFPIKPNHTEENKQKNRRVEFEVLK